MYHYYKTIKQDHLPSLRKQINNLGIAQEHINYVTQSPEGVEIEEGSMGNSNNDLDKAPTGTLSLFGAVFAPVAFVTAGVLIVASGPIAATLGAIGAGTAGVALLLNGIFVPEEKHESIIEQIQKGDVLIHIETKTENAELERLGFSVSSKEQ